MEDAADDDGTMDDVDMAVDTAKQTNNLDIQAAVTDPSDDDYQIAASSAVLSSNQRFSAWILLTAANVVSILALGLGRHKGTSAEKWSIAIVSLSLVFSFSSCLGYLIPVFRTVFVSGPVELSVVSSVRGLFDGTFAEDGNSHVASAPLDTVYIALPSLVPRSSHHNEPLQQYRGRIHPDCQRKFVCGSMGFLSVPRLDAK